MACELDADSSKTRPRPRTERPPRRFSLGSAVLLLPWLMTVSGHRPAGCKRKPSPVSETVKVDTFTVSDSAPSARRRSRMAASCRVIGSSRGPPLLVYSTLRIRCFLQFSPSIRYEGNSSFHITDINGEERSCTLPSTEEFASLIQSRMDFEKNIERLEQLRLDMGV